VELTGLVQFMDGQRYRRPVMIQIRLAEVEILSSQAIVQLDYS